MALTWVSPSVAILTGLCVSVTFGVVHAGLDAGRAEVGSPSFKTGRPAPKELAPSLNL